MNTGTVNSGIRSHRLLPATLLLITVAMLGSTGCTALQGVRDYVAYNNHQNDFVLSWRNSAWAHKAWLARQDQFVGQPYFDHFGAGFRDGYADVASGSGGCTPALPPRKYWNWKYQTPEGQGKTAAWFAGYPHGAKAAEEDGAGLYSHIQVSQTMLSEYQLGHEPPYRTPLYLHNPEEWCRQHGEMIDPGMSPEYAPLDGGAMPMQDPAMQQPNPAVHGDPQARINTWPSSSTYVMPASLQQPAASEYETYGARLPKP